MKKNKRRQSAIVLFVILVVLVVGVVSAGIKKMKNSEAVEAVGENVESAASVQESDIFSDNDVFNIAIFGTDEREEEYSEDARADSIMILSVNKKEQSLKLVNLERDMGVTVLSGDHEGEYTWLADCFQYGGADLMLEEIKENLRVDVKRYFRVNFYTFEKVIDELGGVDITLTEDEAEALKGSAKGELVAGENHLCGYDALLYSRLFEVEGDRNGVDRRYNVVQAVIHAYGNVSEEEVQEVSDVIWPLLDTNLRASEILTLTAVANEVKGTDVDELNIPAEGTFEEKEQADDITIYEVDFDENAKTLQDFLYEE